MMAIARLSSPSRRGGETANGGGKGVREAQRLSCGPSAMLRIFARLSCLGKQ
jgi:hypothetical protein